MKMSVIHKIVKMSAITVMTLVISASSIASQATVQTGHLKEALTSNTKKQQFKFIANKLAQLKMPKELVLIPVIESEYNNKAVSHKGAGGIWQLMPATAKLLGISNKQRFQLEPSTKAALNHFNYLYQKFGNWEFAIAAYNAGDGRVEKALKKNPAAKSVKQLSLPRETKLYVQKFHQMQNEFKTYDA